jgi:integrase
MATRRHGNGEGTIRQRPDGRWEARLHLPDGTRKSFYGATRQDVARRLAEGRRDRDKGLPIVREKQAVATFLADWLEVVRPTVKPRTWIRYRQLVSKHANPALGTIKLMKLTPQQVQGMYANKLAEGLSTTTVNHLHAVLHRAFDQAVRWGLVVRNVCDLVDAPRMAHHEMQVLTPDQAKIFLAAAQGHRLEALFVLALTTGLREGELLALKWRDLDLDLDGGTLQVRGSLQRTDEGLVIGTPKTPQSRRHVGLTTAAITALRAHRTRQLEERLQLGPSWHDHDLVFANAIGRPLEASDLLQRQFYPLLQRAGLPHIRFHDLRHTAATLLLLQGIHPKVVSEMLGHSQVGITLNLYSHVLPNMQRDATAAMDRLLST